MAEPPGRPLRDTIELPEPAAGLWRRTAGTLRRHVAALGDDRETLRLGGGTILAAQWKHRRSFDIDITVSERTPLAILDGAESSFRHDLEALGGVPDFDAELGSWAIEFDKSKVELWARDPLLDAGERVALIHGQRTTILSNAQILRGKLERAELNLPRDVFDVVCAHEIDPSSLEWALNALPARQAMTRTASWKLNHAYIAATAPVALEGISEADRRALSTLGARATEIAWNAVYDRMSIRIENDLLRVNATRRDGREREWTCKAAEVETQCRRRGLNRRLEATTGRGNEILSYAAAQALQGGNARALYEESRGIATHWETADGARNAPLGATQGPKPTPPDKPSPRSR